MIGRGLDGSAANEGPWQEKPMGPTGTDAVDALRWGLRRYWAVVLACLLLGAVAAPVWALRQEPPVEASALVVAERLDMELAALPRYGEAIFDNGAVAQAVAAEFGAAGDFEDIVPDQTSVVAEQDSIVFEVVGHDDDPQTAAAIANLAAQTFVGALNAPGAGVGAFAVQSQAVAPVAPDPLLSPRLGLPVGMFGGALLGIVAVAVVLVVRRPVLEAADAEEVTGVPTLGKVTIPRTRGGADAPPEAFGGLVPVCRRLLLLPTPSVVLVSRPRQDKARTQLAAALNRVLEDVPEGRATSQHRADRSNGHGHPHRPVVHDGSEPLDVLQRPESTATVLVVPEGIGSTPLRAAVVEHLGSSGEIGLLLVKRVRRWRAMPVSAADEAEVDTTEAPAVEETVPR
jgi:capsular polysaccharide biosynthesis protein